jgi:hypothetical protein
MPTGLKKKAPATRRTAAKPTAISAAAPIQLEPPSHDAIATRAYELFLRRGAQHGQDWDDWLAAERELRA